MEIGHLMFYCRDFEKNPFIERLRKGIIEKKCQLFEHQEEVELTQLLREIGEVDDVHISIIIFKMNEKEQKMLQKLTTVLEDKEVEKNKDKIESINVCLHKQIKQTIEMPLELICKTKKMGISVNVNLFPESSEEGPETPREIKLGFMSFYYDVDAVSEELIATKEGFVPSELEDSVTNKGLVPEKFWYWDEESAVLWMNLTKSKKYSVIQDTTRLLRNNIREILGRIEKDSDFRSIDFIDLGVGTPEKDIEILDGIVEHMEDSMRSSVSAYSLPTIYYYPFDISFPLLEYTLRYILYKQRMFKNKKIDLQIFPVIGDFYKINEIDYQNLLKRRSDVRLFALLGNTFGNLLEDDFLDKISSLMDSKDYLLIDVEYSKASPEMLQQQYFNEEVYNFVFHPVELLGIYNKGSYKENMDVKIISREKPGKIYYYYKGAKQYSKVTSVPASKIVAIFYKPQPSETREENQIFLAWSTKYDKGQLEIFLKERGFDIIWKNDNGNYGIYLLKLLKGEEN